MNRLAALDSALDAALSACDLKAALGAVERAVEAAFDTDAPVESLIALRASAVERIVTAAWMQSLGPSSPAALLAVGGFARGELHPKSDVDLLVLLPERATPALTDAVARFLRALWDAGIAVGHGVRTVADSIAAGADDLTIATNLIEARFIGGSGDLATALAAGVGDASFWPPARYAAARIAEQAARHARFGDTAYNLEPNIKQGPGGLRDLQTAIWIAARLRGAASVDAVLEQGLVTAREHADLVAARGFLWRVRFALHLASRRAEERLLFDHQRMLAERLRFESGAGPNSGVERMMQRLFVAMATVVRVTERLRKRLLASPAGDAPAVDIDSCFALAGGILVARHPVDFVMRPELAIRLFRIPLDHPGAVELDDALLDALDAALPSLALAIAASAMARAEFIVLIDHPGAVDQALADMARRGVLGCVIPEFAQVVGHMQFDLFHVYTVDRHTLNVIRNIRAFAAPDAEQRFTLASSLYARLRRPGLLVLAGLFHDIAKGRGGDHAMLGAADAEAFGVRFDVPPGDRALVAFLVEHHLLMSLTAQKRDLGDPLVIRGFAETVGDEERLDALYCLTVADISATSPKLWNAWKDRLLGELHRAARDALARGLAHPLGVAERVAAAKAGARARIDAADAAVDALWADFPDDSFLRYSSDQLVWQTRLILAHIGDATPLVAVRSTGERAASELFVHTVDRPGIFATLTAVIDRMGLNVTAARIVTGRNGRTLDTIDVVEQNGLPLDPKRAQQLALRIRDELDRDPLTARPARRVLSRAARSGGIATRIDFEATESGRSRLCLVTTDRPGLLAHVAAALRECAVNLHDARIATFGERAEDYFELTGANGMLDPGETAAVRAALDRHLGDGAEAAVALAGSSARALRA